MLRMPTSQALPGMVLAEPVYHPQHGSVVLLKSGVTLDDHTIKRLQEMLVGDLWIRYPRLDSLRRFVSQDVVVSCREMGLRIARALDQVIVDRHARLEYHPFRQAVSLVLEALAASPTAAVYVTDMADHASPALRHASNTCFLSLLMGLKLEFYLVHERGRLQAAAARDLTPLGVGAMMHDVGLTRLDPGVVERWSLTHDEDDPEWRRHVHLGFDMVKGEFDPAASAVVLHHHQAFDGSGFPAKKELSGESRPVAGSEIHVFARVAAAAEQLCRLRFPDLAPGSHATDAPSMPTVRALKTLLSPSRRDRLDPIVLRALLAVAPAYAPGTIVRLSTGRQGVVVDWTPEDPCRPVVETIEDLAKAVPGSDAPGERVDLRKAPGVSIAECDGFDVREDNFYPAHEGEFDLARVARAMFNRAEGDLAAKPGAKPKSDAA